MKCLGIWRSGIRPGGYGLTFVSTRSLVHQRAAKTFHLRWRVAGETDHTVPYGTGLSFRRFQAFHAWLTSLSPYRIVRLALASLYSPQTSQCSKRETRWLRLAGASESKDPFGSVGNSFERRLAPSGDKPKAARYAAKVAGNQKPHRPSLTRPPVRAECKFESQ
jgi:hypothetical protein